MQNNIPVKVNNVSKTYKPKSKYPAHALVDVSFELLQGEVTGLIGPNGAGKTTLLRIILGMLKPDKGDIEIFGDSPDSLDSRINIGYQADSHYRSKTINVRSFLEFHSRIAGFGQNTEQIRQLLEYFQMHQSVHKSLQALSRGLRQKVELMQAFLGNPRLVILDEPTASLDPPSVFELRDYIIELKKKGITILFSSHNLTEVERICDRVLFINRGILMGDFNSSAMNDGFLEEAFRKYDSERSPI